MSSGIGEIWTTLSSTRLTCGGDISTLSEESLEDILGHLLSISCALCLRSARLLVLLKIRRLPDQFLHVPSCSLIYSFSHYKPPCPTSILQPSRGRN
jgi:hypothetical protein